jgi:hypothetical protein
MAEAGSSVRLRAQERLDRAPFVHCCVAAAAWASLHLVSHSTYGGGSRLLQCPSVGGAWGGAPPGSGRDGERGEGGKHGPGHE